MQFRGTASQFAQMVMAYVHPLLVMAFMLHTYYWKLKSSNEIISFKIYNDTSSNLSHHYFITRAASGYQKH